MTRKIGHKSWAVDRDAALLTAAILFALVVRLTVGLHSYSGAGDAPKFGDYEAQRHWMEVTVNLPIKDWYRETADNELKYWGLDYPPLSAYQSWLYGKLLQALEPEAVALHQSRGYETPSSKLYLRWSVILSDILLFIPAVCAAVYVFNRAESAESRRWTIVVALLQPAAVIIDHGHFQYNNISLGLSAAAAAAVGGGRQLLGSCLFCLALNHKQMSMYYAPAFFAHLLGRALQNRTLSGKVWGVARLGGVVLVTFAVCWGPYLGSWSDLQQVLHRLVPLHRHLYEDYVANFWCVSSPLFKWKQRFSQEILVRFTTCATLAGILPAMAHQIQRPSSKGLLYAMANTSFAFYMLSYQVHEKSILLPLMPLSLLATSEPLLAAWLPAVAAFSMFPLLKRDGLWLCYAALLLLWSSMPHSAQEAVRSKGVWRLIAVAKRGIKYAIVPSVFLGVLIHLLAEYHRPPEALPHLHDAMFVSLACVHLAAGAVVLNLRQWQLGSAFEPRKFD